jgi:adenylate cyclase
MGIEIERKFLVANDAWRKEAKSSARVAQGYLASDPERTVRVRTKGEQAFLTIKGRSTDGISRAEFEYAIPVADAKELLKLCQTVIDKTRHLIDLGGFTWEVDEFHGDNDGLIVAEIELPAKDATFARPSWLAAEVTGDARYYNAALASMPYRRWPKK